MNNENPVTPADIQRIAGVAEPKEKRCEFVGERRGRLERCGYIAADWSTGKALCGRHAPYTFIKTAEEYNEMLIDQTLK